MGPPKHGQISVSEMKISHAKKALGRDQRVRWPWGTTRPKSRSSDREPMRCRNFWCKRGRRIATKHRIRRRRLI
jgi:hypothetical protein